MDKALRIVATLCTIAMPFIVVLYVATFWAIGKSQERTACYSKPDGVCEQPGRVESAIRWVLGWS